MKKVSKKDLFGPIVEALRPDAERLKLAIGVMPETIWKVGIGISNENINVNVPTGITDVETIRFLMEQVERAHREGVAKGKREAQLAVMASMNLTVNADGFVKLEA